MTHETTPPEPGPKRLRIPPRKSRMVETVAVVILSLAALLTAWSAYQAAAWGTTMNIKFSQASTNRMLAARATTAAGQMTAIDISLFTNWLDAYASGNQELAQFYERRFRPDFQPAFEAWIATQPRTNPDAPKSPFAMPEYRIREAEEAIRLDEQGAALYNEGLVANDKGDGYSLATVILAAVLFFVGMSGRMKWYPLRIIMVTIGGVLLITAVVRFIML